MKRTARPVLRALSPLVALLVSLALLLAQGQALVHRVLHVPGHVHASDHEHEHEHEHDVAGHGVGVWGWLALIAGHEDESDCRLFDQGGHGDLPQALPALVLPTFLPPGWVAVYAAVPPAWREALIQARGPPALR